MSAPAAAKPAPPNWPRRFAVLALLAGVLLAAATYFRASLTYVIPIRHEGVVMRISPVVPRAGAVRARREYAIFFDDGFKCIGTDASLAAVKAGDRVVLKGYHDVRGTPLLDPTWWACDEGHLEQILPP